MTIREQVSAILGVRIEENHWDVSFKRLDISGKMTMRKMMEIVAVLCKKVEEIENGQKGTSV